MWNFASGAYKIRIEKAVKDEVKKQKVSRVEGTREKWKISIGLQVQGLEELRRGFDRNEIALQMCHLPKLTCNL